MDVVLRRRCSRPAGSLIAGGNLIKKVLFPAEVLPIVSVLPNMVHFVLGLMILVGVHGRDAATIPSRAELIWFPVIVAVQLMLHAGAGA